MEQLDIFGTKIHEYLLVIEPDKPTINKLTELKNLLNLQIPLSKDNLHSKPHITICYFEANDFSDELIMGKAKQTISKIECFDIVLDGCEKWKNGTFILKVRQVQHIQKLQDGLSSVFKGLIKSPHLTIARNVNERSLNSLPVEDFQYHGSFLCESILLLKKNGNNPYQVLDRISLFK